MISKFKDVKNEISITLYYLPVTVIGLIVALRTLIYGLGYIIPTSGFEQTVLYSQLATLIFPVLAGLVFVITAIVMSTSLIKQNAKWVKLSFTFNAFIWLFAFFVYIIAGTPLLGLGLAGTFCLISGYIGSSYTRRHDVALYNALKGENKWD